MSSNIRAAKRARQASVEAKSEAPMFGAPSIHVPDMAEGASAITMSGMIWLCLVHALATAMIGAWMVFTERGATVPKADQIWIWVSTAAILLIDVILLGVSRWIKASDVGQQMTHRIMSAISFLSSVAWITLVTGMSDLYWPVVMVVLATICIGMVAVAASPTAIVARLAGAYGTFAVLGHGPWVKLALGVLATLAAVLIYVQTRRRQALYRQFDAAHEHAVAAQQMLDSFERSGRGWFWRTDAEGHITYMSAAQAALFGSEAQSVIGRSLASLVTQEGDESGKVDRAIGFTLAAGVDFSDLVVRAACEEERWWSLSGMALHDRKGRCIGFHGSGADLTEQRKTEAEARQLARYDGLTSLANRVTIRKTLEDALQPQGSKRPDCALLLLDLDRFKNVNDTLGHPVGDELLKIVAKRLLRIVGQDCQVGRLGGDEFQVVVPECEDKTVLARLAESIIERLSLPYDIDGVDIRIGASVGIAVAPTDGIDADELTRNADLALYAAKEAGKGVHRFYEPQMHAGADERRALENDLREMLGNREIALAFQPVVDASSEAVVGYEALARWCHPKRGHVPPSVFIPIAEEIGLVGRIGEYVMREACRQAVSWPNHLRVAVNLSPKQFETPRLAATLDAILKETGLAPERLEIEITEGALLSGDEGAAATLDALAAMGVRLVLDDFGTGYSSLGYVQRVAFSKIKIDQSFVRGAADRGSRNSAIIRAIVGLAESLGMETVAEGVETLGEIELIRSLGCTQMQGYIFGAPRDADLTQYEAGQQSGDPRLGGADNPVTREDRISLLRIARMRSGNSTASVKIRNVSSRGLVLEVPGDVPISPDVTVELPDGTSLRGQVRWRKGHRIGLYFAEPIAVELVIGKPGLVRTEGAGADEPDARQHAA